MTNDQRFTLYANVGRVFAQNPDGRVIELGKLAQDERGKYSFRLNGDGARGYGFASLDEALESLGLRITLPYMMEQFATAPDRSATRGLRTALRIDVSLSQSAPQ